MLHLIIQDIAYDSKTVSYVWAMGVYFVLQGASPVSNIASDIFYSGHFCQINGLKKIQFCNLSCSIIPIMDFLEGRA